MTPAVAALTRAGIAFTLHEYAHDPRATSYGLEAAQALRLDPDQVLKTLLADLDGELVVAIVPVSARLDLKALARALGGRRAQLAEPADAQRATGYVTGGISPLGQRTRLPCVIDDSAATHDRVLVSSGRRGQDIALAPTDLVRLTGATLAPLGRAR